MHILSTQKFSQVECGQERSDGRLWSESWADVNIVAFRGKFRGLVLPFSCPITRVAAPLAERGEKERERERN